MTSFFAFTGSTPSARSPTGPGPRPVPARPTPVWPTVTLRGQSDLAQSGTPGNHPIVTARQVDPVELFGYAQRRIRCSERTRGVVVPTSDPGVWPSAPH